MQLQNKHIVITGATSGIGKALAILLSKHNQLTVIGRSQEKLEQLKQQLTNINIVQADLSEQLQVEEASKNIHALQQPVDILINNAAIQYTPRLIDDEFDYNAMGYEVAVNFTNICRLTYLLLPLLKKAPKAVILNINSGLALFPKTTSAIYCASKAALNSFSQSLHWQLSDTNISVQQAFLPLVDTSMTHGRGTNKMTVQKASQQIIFGLENNKSRNDIGKVKLLRMLQRLAPSVAQRIMQHA